MMNNNIIFMGTVMGTVNKNYNKIAALFNIKKQYTS